MQQMLCSSPEFLARVAASLPKKHTLLPHLVAAQKSRATPMPLTRTLDEMVVPDVPTYEALATLPQARLLSLANCHNGQLKLTLSVLEFLGVALSKLGVPHSDVLVVYAGASGMASVVAAHVFPELHFWLYDPAPNTVQLMPRFDDKAIVRTPTSAPPDPSKRIVVFTDKAGWFSDDVARAVRAANPRKHLLFISDIRSLVGEDDIAADMRRQARWTLLTGAALFMFKFRIPYLTPENERAILEGYSDLGAIEEGTGERLVRSKEAVAPATAAAVIPYLKGDLYIQLYGRPHTVELRMIGERRKDGKYATQLFDVRDIEGKMALFNTVHRSHTSYKFGSTVGDFDGVSEVAIISRCARALLGRAPTKAQVQEMQEMVHRTVQQFIKKDASSCALLTATKRMDRVDTPMREFLVACHAKVAASLPPTINTQIRRALT